MKNKTSTNISLSESKLLKESRKIYDLQMKIHKLLERLVIKTNLGSIEESYADETNFDIGEYSIYSCEHYQQLVIFGSDGSEHELEHDLENSKILYNKIIKRERDFDRLIVNNGLKTAVKVFDKSIEFNWGDENE